MENKIMEQYGRWLRETADAADTDIIEELKAMEGEEKAIEDAFYQDLTFGTGGLRGIIGAGTNRMNVYTVGKASQGLADYVVKNFPEAGRKIAVSYDSRIKSDLFAKIAAGVFAANGIKVFIYDRIMPTPCLSYAVRALGCAAGVMVTASHNPSKYNGYKVYGADGCQITSQAAGEIFNEIRKLDIFCDVKQPDFQKGIEKNHIQYISEQICTDFISEVKKQSVLGNERVSKDLSIVYSPLNGTGLEPVLRILQESGYDNVTVVEEQRLPDGNFPTCPYPNPEEKEAMTLGLAYAKERGADLLLATDPDCDRVGIAVKNHEGSYVLLSGNETGMLLLDYICSRRIALGTMPKDPVAVKTIVTTRLGERIAAHYGVRIVNVLTGFKYIGEQIGMLEKEGRADSFIFGFEESYGYLSGSYVRDKDAVVASFLICEMAAFYKTRGVSLWDRLRQLYEQYGYCLNTLHSYQFQGMEGFARMKDIMQKLRGGLKSVGSRKVVELRDYSKGLAGLPKSNVLEYVLEDDCVLIVRPSGTEPKLKVYFGICAENAQTAGKVEAQLLEALEQNVLAVS